ncbi:MAG: phosphoglycerate kinase [Gemmatimonadota bacterium]|nr:phosphoglycerate kinase [Gemmatimonadota bacterium]
MRKKLSNLDPARLSGRVALVRADFNVPTENGRITDDGRIRASLPTLRMLSDAGARTVVMSHMGRPKGRPEPKYTLAPVAERLEELLGRPVEFVPEPVGPSVEAAVRDLSDGGVLLLENTRYLPGDTGNDPELAGAWASLADLFVYDAFGTAHRAHASTSGLAEAVIERGGEAVVGMLLDRELRFLNDALRDPERPFIGILGGAKMSGKIPVISALLRKVDRLLIGGAMANTFFRALGLDTGASLVEEDRVDMARELIREAENQLVLPLDCIVADEVAADARTRVVDREAVGPDDRIMDIGPRTRAHYAALVGEARTIVWNGPMGVFEMPPFAEGTMSIAHAVAEACDDGALGIVGGGDSGAAAERAGVADRISHISTGGGASLDLLAGEVLPGVASLTPASVSQEEI